MGTFDPSKYFADRMSRGCDTMKKAVTRMPEDKQNWQPTIEGNAARSAVNQAMEIAWMNDLGAKMFGTEPDAKPSWDQYYADIAAHEAAGDWEEWLSTSAEKFAAVIAAFPGDKWNDEVFNPFYEKPGTFATLLDLFYWNLCYHIGQVNYIQVLYGDKD